MKYPDHETYAILYARFFRRDRLLKLLENIDFEDRLVLDLCCGAGQVSLEAMERSARHVIAIDESRDMTSPELHQRQDIIVGHTSVERCLMGWPWKPAEIVICQQAVNYWLTSHTAKLLRAVMPEDGIFVFNTFANRPSETPSARKYELNGRHYWEYHHLIGDVVHHVQACNGIPPHVTSFKWLSEEKIRSILDGLFEVDTCYEAASVIYRCTAV